MGQVIIIGGGLAGLICSIQLAKSGIACTVIEKKSYPLHRVCGEYISNETLPFLKQAGLYPEQFAPSNITEFVLSSVSGRLSRMKLDLGGFGISRYAFDNFLYEKAKSFGVECIVGTEVRSIRFEDDKFRISTEHRDYESTLALAAFGKRSKLDIQMQRKFVRKRSPYVGIKYHALMNHPADQIALHNFEEGYCGVSNVENGITNICYLTSRNNLQRAGSIAELEQTILYKNPHLRQIFEGSQFLFKKPEVINEISFAEKEPVENHLLMLGDAAGMIAPLCGNGMAMAIHSAKIAADIIPEFLKGRISRIELEKRYSGMWRNHFSSRLWRGRTIQHLFGNHLFSNFAVNLVLYSRPLAKILMRSTHGKPF